MSDIKNVNYAEMKNQISVIWSSGSELKNAMKIVYNELLTINEKWTGKKCNAFLQAWNNSINAIQKYMQFLQYDVSVYVGKVMSRFSDLDGDHIGATGFGWGPGISEVEMTDESTLRFISEEARNSQQTIIKGFIKSNEAIDEILAKVIALPWDSTSADAFMPIFERLSQDAKNQMNETSEMLNKMIEETAIEVENVENINKQEGEAFGNFNS